MARFLIYGGTGYTGKLIVAEAAKRRLKGVVAGRNQARVKAVAESHGHAFETFGLDDHERLVDALQDIDVVLHCAGPFSATSAPMVAACLETGTHYLDITGEIDVFEACAAKNDEARTKGVMLMPGVGFDVVPSDCLAAHVAGRVTDCRGLILGISGLSGASRGTAKTMVESLGIGTRVRRGGHIVALKETPTTQIDFGSGPVECVGVGWGDVATAWHSTGARDIDVYFELTPDLQRMAKMGGFTRFLMSLGFMQKRLKAKIDRQPEGPTAQERAAGGGVLWARADGSDGSYAEARLKTPNGYSLTADSAVSVLQKALEGQAPAGFQTPATAYGADFVLDLAGVTRENVAVRGGTPEAARATETEEADSDGGSDVPAADGDEGRSR